MTMLKLRLLLLLCVAGAGLSGLNPVAGSAFQQPVNSAFSTSLLSLPEAAHDDSISIYGAGLYHPFASLPRFGDAVLDAFRFGKARHSLLGYQSPDRLLKAEFNILAGYEPVWADSQAAFFYKGFRLESALGRHWQLNTDWYNGMFFGSQSQAAQSELIDGYIKDTKGRLNLDNLSADLSYNAKNLCLALGRGKFPLGNSISGSIIANDKVNDYAYLLAEGTAGAFTLSFLHGSLKADSTYNIYTYPSQNSKNYPDKYIAIHQLSYHPRHNLNLFIGETVVYGNRSIDLNYLLPNAFWRAVEHNLGDRDNVLIFSGGSYQPLNPLFVYAQLAVDEFSYGKLTTDWWGNKYAVQSGVRYTLPSFIPDSPQPDLTCEFTAVRPFTYTHYLNHTMYSHDGRPLGYPKGSNLIDLSTLLRVPLGDRITWQSGIAWTKQGSFGSDWRQNYHDAFPGQDLQTATAHWFEGTVTKTAEFNSSLLLDIFAHHRLLAGLKATRQTAWDQAFFAAWQFVY